MKKYFVIAATFSSVLFGCSKVSTTPDLQASRASQVTAGSSTSQGSSVNSQGSSVTTGPSTGPAFQGGPAHPTNHCYTLTNTETSVGFVEYRVVYTDCSGVIHNVPLPMGQSITFCSTNGVIQANFAYTLADLGVC